MLDTSTTPGTAPNLVYWDATWNCAAAVGFPSVGGAALFVRDIIEMQFDGYEERQ